LFQVAQRAVYLLAVLCFFGVLLHPLVLHDLLRAEAFPRVHCQHAFYQRFGLLRDHLVLGAY